jgi:hypothetical protein
MGKLKQMEAVWRKGGDPMKQGTLTARHRSAEVMGLMVLVATCALLVCGLHAQNSQPQARAERLSYVDGMVRLSQGNQVLADQAVVNTTLFEGTQIAADDNGKAEIQFENGNIVRIAPNSAVTLKVLKQKAVGTETEIVLDNGLGYFELQGTNPANVFRIRFGDCVVTASDTAVLRINMDKAPGEVAVFSGSAHLERAKELALDLRSGESVDFSSAAPTEYNLSESIEPDSWDSWNTDRDQALKTEENSGTTATSGNENNNLAWGDLNANGIWYNVPGEGNVWSPYDASDSGWDPYGEGNWVWNPGFGYYWVSAYPWGYLPYQCGMWNYYDAFGWGWLPGRGGCSTWWGLGYYRMNIGLMPGGYRMPRVPGRPIIGQPGRGRGPHPVLSVNRFTSGGSGTLPQRSRSTPVVIAGHTVQALRPLAPRQQYDRSTTNQYGNHVRFIYPGAAGQTGPGVGGNANTYRRSTMPAPSTVGSPGATTPASPASGNSPRAPSGAPGSSASRPTSSTRSSSGSYSGSGGGSHSSSSSGGSHASGGSHR